MEVLVKQHQYQEKEEGTIVTGTSTEHMRFLLCSAPLLKAQENQYDDMAMHQCQLKMTLDSCRYVGLCRLVGETKIKSPTETTCSWNNVRMIMETQRNRLTVLSDIKPTPSSPYHICMSG